jgi:hypothetical protein
MGFDLFPNCLKRLGRGKRARDGKNNYREDNSYAKRFPVRHLKPPQSKSPICFFARIQKGKDSDWIQFIASILPAEERRLLTILI